MHRSVLVATAALLVLACSVAPDASRQRMSLRPYADTISGVADQNGNVSIPWAGLAGTWGSLIVIAQSAGFPRWTLIRQGRPVAVGRGPSAPLQFPPVPPQQPFALLGAGLQPGANVTGDITGMVSDVGLDELPLAAPQPGTIAMDTANPRQKLFPVGAAVPTDPYSTPSFSVGAGGQGTPSFLLPPGTVELRLHADQPSLVTPVPWTLTMVGHQSGNTYFNRAVLFPILPVTIVVDPENDRQVDLTVNNAGGSSLPFDVSALFGFETPGQTEVGQSVTLVSPAIWQAPNEKPINIDTTIAGGGNFTIATGVAGSQIVIFSVTIAVDAAPGSGGFELQDDLGNILHTFISTGAGPQPPQQLLAFGAPIFPGLGHGIRLHNNFAGSLTLFGSAVISSGVPT